MAVFQSVPREEIRLAAGYNASGVFEGSTTSGSAGTTDLIDTKVRGADDDHNGKWIIVTSGARDGDIAQVTDWVASTNTFTVSPAFGGTLASGVTYELWDHEYRPQFVNNCINQAIHYVSGKAYDPEEDITLHLHANSRRYVAPANIAAVSKLEYRRSVASASIDACESGWTEQSNVTQAFDTSQRMEGSASLQLILAGGLSAGDDIASKTITSLDLSKYDFLELWGLSSIAISANDFALRLTSGSTTLSFDIPAMTADTDTYHRIAMTTDQARQLTAVTTIVIRQTVDVGACTVWFDDIKAVDNSTAKWEKIGERLWDADKQAGEIVFKPDMGTVPYGLLKITGGDEPALLNADATVSEVDPTYVIAFTSHLLLMAPHEGTDEERRDRRSLGLFWRNEAENRVRGLQPVRYRQVR